MHRWSKIITRKFLSFMFMDIGCVISEFYNQAQILYCVEAISIFLKKSKLLQEMLPETDMLLSQVNIY